MHCIIIDDVHFENLTLDDIDQLSAILSAACGGREQWITPNNAAICTELCRLTEESRLY